jgi:hypothetical protein
MYNIHSKTALSMTTTDGRIVKFRPMAENATNGTGNGNKNRTVGPFTDAGEGSVFQYELGELYADCPESGTLQIWTVAQCTPSNADFNAAGTLTMVLEDQFGHRMSIPFQLSGTVSAAQAA